MKIYLNLLTKKANSGFTLIELILASVGMFFVVMAAGYGVFVLTRENVAANAASDTQYNLNRAVDFISEEVKMASAIETTTTNASGFTLPTGGTAILVLQIPGVTSRVVYSIAPSSNPWLGPNVISRWGPNINSTGAYTDPSVTTGWTNLPLVDLIANRTLSTGCPGTINNGSTTGWTQIQSSNISQQGFYVCIQNVATGARKYVEIRASASALNAGSMKQINTSDTNSRFYDKATYEVITQVYARAANP
jgi:hypothetical protein